MDDLRLAKQRLKDNDLSLVIVKDGKIITEGKSGGIIDLIQAVQLFGDNLNGASAADSVVGRAAAFLFVHVGIRSIFAKTISDGALRILTESDIRLEFENLVPAILNKQKAGLCPFEKLTLDSYSPEEACKKIMSFLQKD